MYQLKQKTDVTNLDNFIKDLTTLCYILSKQKLNHQIYSLNVPI